MTATDRRAALTMVAGAVGAVGASLLAPAAALRAGEALALPPAPMVLQRRLERGLGDGAAITVEREWSVGFARQGSGVAVSGLQAAVRIDAPPSLAHLAGIEAQRSTDAMFPILLSDRGVIVAGGQFVLQLDLDRAIDEAEQIIARQPAARGVKEDQLFFLALLQRSAGRLLDHLPADLFYPASLSARSVREIALPDGTVGEYDVRYEALRAVDAQWLGRAEREVVTRIGPSVRRSREMWSLRQV